MGIAKLIKKRAVISDHGNGDDIKTIARRYGITVQTVKNYLKEEKEKKENAKAAKAQEEEKAKRKKERDKERRTTLKARSALSQERKDRVKAYVDTGMSPLDVAKKEGLAYGTITDYIRTGKMTGLMTSYKDENCIAVRKNVINQWAREQIARQIRTPEGKMTVCEVYPHIMRLIQGKIYYTYTNAQLYYMNAR